jgi:hypothetical protein
MRRTLLAIIMSALAAGGMSLAHHDEHGKGGAQVKLLSQKDIIEKLDGKQAKATMVEVTLTGLYGVRPTIEFVQIAALVENTRI